MRAAVPVLIVLGLALLPLAAEAPEWDEFDILPGESVWASSVLEETLAAGTVRYDAVNIFDGDPSTAWVEAAEGPGIGESLVFTLDRRIDMLSIVPGFARSRRLFLANGRPRRLRITLLGGFTAPGLISETDARRYFITPMLPSFHISLADSLESQPFAVPWSADQQADAFERLYREFRTAYPFFADEQAAELGYSPRELESRSALDEFTELALTAFGTTMLKLEILAVYPGSRYEDTCIAEVSINP